MKIRFFPLIRIPWVDYITKSFEEVNWALVLGLWLEDIIKGRALVLGILFNLLLSLSFGLVFWAYTPIILNPINYKLLFSKIID